MENNWHVYPVNDLLPHNTESMYCECNPKLERNENDDGWIIVHNAWDGRETREKDNEKYGKVS